MIARQTNTCDVEAALARSAAYGLIAALLRYPDEELVGTLTDSPQWSATRGSIATSLPALLPHFDAIDHEFQRGGDAPRASESLGDTYNELFGHAVRGSCPLYELEYSQADILQRASDLADITGFYQAFGLELADQAAERPDHATVECEFMTVLTAKHVHALEADDEDACGIVSDAQRSFLADHMAHWFPAFGQRLIDADPNGFYGLVGQFVRTFVRLECDLLDVPCGPSLLELGPVDPKQDREIECGVELSCPGAGAGAAGQQPLVQLGIDQS